jgi:hypothetical protein
MNEMPKNNAGLLRGRTVGLFDSSMVWTDKLHYQVNHYR